MLALLASAVWSQLSSWPDGGAMLIIEGHLTEPGENNLALDRKGCFQLVHGEAENAVPGRASGK